MRERCGFQLVVSNLDSGEPVWFGRERKKGTVDDLFQSELSAGQRMRITAACVDMWQPYRLIIEQWAHRRPPFPVEESTLHNLSYTFLRVAPWSSS